MKTLLNVITMLAVSSLLIFSFGAKAEPQDNEHAMHGVKNGKVLFDITLSEPRSLTGQMEVIRETYHDLQALGVEPNMVLAFHGNNVNFLTSHLNSVAFEDLDQVEAFNQSLNKLMQLKNVRVEVCAIATRAFGADRDAIRKGIHLVGNTYVSNIGYDKQGYTIIGIR